MRCNLKTTLIALISVIIVSVILLSSVPPVGRDSLSHHLAIPKLYIENGKITEIESIKYSYYPMNLELLYLIPMSFGNDIIPKYIHFIFAILTAFLIFIYLKKKLTLIYALFGVLFFLSLPIILKLSISAYVDLGLVFFSFASIFFIFMWIENEFKLAYLIYSAIFCGLALGTKYNGLVIFFILACFVPLIYSKFAIDNTKKFKKIIIYSLAFILISLAIFSPWMIKNFIWTKNPIYPLYNKIFNLKPFEESDKMKPLAIRKIIYKETLAETLSIPIRIFFQGQDNNPRYFDGKLNPLLFILPFFAFLGFRNNSKVEKYQKLILLSFSIIFLFIAFFSIDMRIRYIVPIIPPLILLSVFGLFEINKYINCNFKDLKKQLSTILLVLIVSFFLLINFKYIYDQFNYVKPFSYITNKLTRQQYITKQLPEYPVIKWANKNINKTSYIMTFFLGNRIYYSDIKMHYYMDTFSKIVKTSNSDKMILDKLRIAKITHFMIRHDLFNTWLNTNFSYKEKLILQKFFKNDLKVLYSKNGYTIFELEG